MDSFQMKLNGVINNIQGGLSFLRFVCFSANFAVRDQLAVLLQSCSARRDFGLFSSTSVSESNLYKSRPVQALSSYKTGGHVKHECGR